MGADIHLVLEKKNKAGEWVGVNNFGYVSSMLERPGEKGHIYWRARDRNYDLFAALAGVRGEGPHPKGMPDDASDLARMEFDDDSDLHSHTWYMLRDAVKIFEETLEPDAAAKRVADKLTGERSQKPLSLRYFGIEDDYHEKLDDYRLIIAFDN